MPGKPRIHASSATYHVILRGNAKQDIFSDAGVIFRGAIKNPTMKR